MFSLYQNSNKVLLLFVVMFSLVYTSSCNYREERDSGVDKEVWDKYLCDDSKKNIAYGVYHSKEREAQRLQFDLYFPQELHKKKPLLIFLHSGGFVKGHKGNGIATAICKDFARAGFVAMSANYRLIDLPNFYEFNRSGGSPKRYIKQSIYDAVRDVYTLIRYCKANADTYEIDTSQIYLAGYSAGAMLALNTLFLNQQEADTYFFNGEDTGECLDCLPAINTYQEYTSKVKGIIAISGGIFDENHISDIDDTPLLMIHGNKDQIVPYGKGKPFEKFVNKEISMELPFKYIGVFEYTEEERQGTVKVTLKGDVGIPKEAIKLVRNYLTMDITGSKRISQRIRGRQAKLITIPEGSHTFMVNEEGYLSDDYFLMREKMYEFVRRR